MNALKDFEFDPEVSTADLVGHIVVLRELADSKLWKKKPFDAAHALIDLHMLANNEPGLWRAAGGIEVAYKAGWLLWSNRGLAERWGWRQESVESFLKQLEGLEVVRRHATAARWKAIELAHWRSMDGAPAEHGSVDARSMNGDGRSKELGVGSGSSALANNSKLDVCPAVSVPSKTEVVTWAKDNAVDPEWAASKWVTTTANHGWERAKKLIDWKLLWKEYFEQDVKSGRLKKIGEKITPSTRLRWVVEQELDEVCAGINAGTLPEEDLKALKERAKALQVELDGVK